MKYLACPGYEICICRKVLVKIGTFNVNELDNVFVEKEERIITEPVPYVVF